MFKKLQKKRNQKGFTLVELVVVIAILGILAAIAVPRLTGFRKNAALAADQASAASIGKAAELHAAANNLKEEEKMHVKIITLEEEDLIELELKPQQDGKDEFDLRYEGGKFKVYYKGEGGEQLYPEYAPNEG